MLSVLQHPDWPCMHLISAFTQTLYNGRVGKWRAGKTTLGSAHSLLWHPHHAQSMIILQKSFVGVNVELPCKGLGFSVKPLTIWAVTHVGRQCLFVQSQKKSCALVWGTGWWQHPPSPFTRFALFHSHQNKDTHAEYTIIYINIR